MEEADNHLAEDAALFDFEEVTELDERDRKAMEDIEAGRFISNEAMIRWFRTWGDETPSPPPECGE